MASKPLKSSWQKRSWTVKVNLSLAFDQASIDDPDISERIRNTLSHEMCHLATWVIDQKINEHHGNIFKKW